MCLSVCDFVGVISGNRNMEGVSESGSDSQNSDLLLANIEKFILEFHSNMTEKPLKESKNKDKIYNTENLINILEDNSKIPSCKHPILPFKTKSYLPPVIPGPEITKKRTTMPSKRTSEDKTHSDTTEDKTQSDIPPSVSVPAKYKKLSTAPHKRKIEDKTKSDLPSPISVPEKPKKPPNVPLKRKIEDKTKCDHPPKKINSINPKQKKETVRNSSNSPKCRTTEQIPIRPMRKRGRRKLDPQLQYAKIKELKDAKWEIAKLMPSKRKASAKIHPINTHTSRTYKEVFIDYRNHTRSVKNTARLVIKGEVGEANVVIDLTSEDVSLTLRLNFPREAVLLDIEWETCDILITEEPVRISPFTDLHTAKLFKPYVRVHNVLIDLTHEKDEISSSIVVASEKECAVKILPTLYKFYQTSQLNRIMEGAWDEAGGRTLNYSSRQQTKTICLTLIETLSGLYVRNFKIHSFLEFLTYKFSQKYKVSVSMKDLTRHLQSMLVNLNRQDCRNRFVAYFAKEVDEIVRIKSENEESNLGGLEEEGLVVFTEKQLEQLSFQIEQYNLLVRCNQYMASSFNPSDLEDGFDMNRNQITTGSIPANNPEVQREIKDEILKLNDFN